MVPFMHDDLKHLIKSILQPYIKQSVIDSCSNGIAYKNINLLNKSNIVSTKKLTLGRATELAIAELVKKDLPFVLPQHRKYLKVHLLGQQLFVMQVF